MMTILTGKIEAYANTTQIVAFTTLTAARRRSRKANQKFRYAS